MEDFFDKTRLADRLEEFDQRLIDRMKLGKQNLLRAILRLGTRERLALAEDVHLRASLRNTIRRKQGEIERVGFSFVRHGIFVARGVGKGRPVGSAKAKAAANDWLTPELDILLDDIADLVADGYADIIAAQFRINIPGLYSRITPDK
jgi:hypothetical protein